MSYGEVVSSCIVLSSSAARSVVAATELAACRAAIAVWMARSAATVRSSKASGTRNAMRTSDVVAPTRRSTRRRTVSILRSRDAHADTPHGLQIACVLGGLAQLPPQPRQVNVDGLVAAAVRQLPHLGEQLLPADHLAFPGRQVMQERKLARGQVQLDAVEGRLARARVDPQPP